ncbi:hypothetical protein B566_EDAN011892 [Ephemera danica]|nr:hypothetical protein B566_EDAN011892 [Ephemera danica]
MFVTARSCGPPLGVEHGWTEGDCHTFNCHVLYHCAVGFELSGGRSERICTADGSWMPRELPTCVREYRELSVQCPIPENPLNGKAIYTSCSYNSVVSYECKYGYRLLGEPSRRCGPDKQWTGDAPVCKGK